MTEIAGFGTDVEFLGERDGVIIPLSPDIIPGTKENKVRIGDVAYIELDNVLGEITFDPSANRIKFRERVEISKQEVVDFLKPLGITPVYKSHHIFRPTELLTPWAMAIGCKPDQAADLNDECKEISPSLFRRMRTPGGHMHISVPEPITAIEVIQRVRALDFAIGAPLAMMQGGRQRRLMYGQGGRFRFTTYGDLTGFEYRTPDCWWYGQENSNLAANIFKIVERTMQLQLNHDGFNWINKNHSRLCTALNTDNTTVMQEMVEQQPFYSLSMPPEGIPEYDPHKMFTSTSVSMPSSMEGTGFADFSPSDPEY